MRPGKSRRLVIARQTVSSGEGELVAGQVVVQGGEADGARVNEGEVP